MSKHANTSGVKTKRLYPGYYTAKVSIKATRDGKTTEVMADLVIETNEYFDQSYKWTWGLQAEIPGMGRIDERDEDGGYSTKALIMEAFATPEKQLRNWEYNTDLRSWCI